MTENIVPGGYRIIKCQNLDDAFLINNKFGQVVEEGIIMSPEQKVRGIMEKEKESKISFQFLKRSWRDSNPRAPEG